MKLIIVKNIFVIEEEAYTGSGIPCILCKYARRRKTRNHRIYYSCNIESRGEIKGQIITEWVDRPDDYGSNDFIGCEDAVPKDDAIKKIL